MGLRKVCWAVFAASVLVAGCAEHEEAEAAEDMAKAPVAVQASAKKYLAGRKLGEFEVHTVGGKTTYEVGYEEGKVEGTYVLGAGGELLREQTEIETSKLPAAVTEAVSKSLPGAKIKEASDAVANGEHFYVVEAKVGKTEHVLLVTPAGAVRSDEVEAHGEEKNRAEGEHEHRD